MPLADDTPDGHDGEQPAKFLPPFAHDPEHGVLPVADGDPVGFFLRREVAAGLSSPRAAFGGANRADGFLGPSPAPYLMAAFRRFRPSPPHTTRSRPSCSEAAQRARDRLRSSRPGIPKHSDEPGQPDRKRNHDELGPRQVTQPGRQSRPQCEFPLAPAQGDRAQPQSQASAS